MKRVSFAVAKALRDVGYPQDYFNSPIYTQKGEFRKFSDGAYNYEDRPLINAPTYLEVWLWLCRTKVPAIIINVTWVFGSWTAFNDGGHEGKDPEEAIENAINYLVEHNLIK